MMRRDAVTSLVFLMTSWWYVQAQTMPADCTYDSGLYTCDYAALSGAGSLPLQESDFVPVAQRLRINNLPSTLSSSFLHADFVNISTGSYDPNYPATLELDCNLGSALTLSTGVFSSADYVQDLKILNCALGALPANVFDGLGTLDRLTIENGTITSIDAAALTGVTMVRNTVASYPEIHGAFVIKNTKLSGTIPEALFLNQTDMYELVLQNMGLTSINDTVFDGCPNLRHLDLSHNAITDIPGAALLTLSNLGTFDLHGTDVWECSCTKLEFFSLVTSKYVQVLGDIVCKNTTNYDNKLALQYYQDNCVTEESTCTDGVELIGSCLTPIDLTGFSLGTVAFILGWVVLGLTIHTQKQADPAKGKVKPMGKRKPKDGGKKPKSGWA